MLTCIRPLLCPILLLGACVAPAGAQGNAASANALRAACSGDVSRLCANVQPGGGRIIACLKQHKDELSDQCRQAGGLPPRGNTGTTPSAAGPASPSGAAAPSLSGSLAPLETPVPSSNGTASSTSDAAGSSQSFVPIPEPPAPASPSTTSSSSRSSSKGSARPAPASGQTTKVAGEEFVRRAIPDPAHSGMTAATLRLPKQWKLNSKVDWHYDWIENPLVFSANAVNPDNAEAFTLYPLLRMESIEVAPQYRQYVKGKQAQPGERMGMGAINMPLQPPAQALQMFIKQVRPNAQNLKWVGQQDLPGLAQALKLNPWPNDHGLAIKVSYDLDGQPVEEAFFGVYYVSASGNQDKSVGSVHMGANMIKQTNWGFRALQSFRAPAGTLDKRMPVFCLIAKSFAYSPEWTQLNKQINDQLLAGFNQKLQQGYDQIRAAQAIMAQVQAQEKAVDASVAKQDAMLRTSTFDDSWLRTSSGGGGGGSPRSSADHFDDNIRGVDTMNDPSTGGTTQLSNAGQYHFTDGFGNYRTTDDPNYTPEKAGEVGSWTPMTAAP